MNTLENIIILPFQSQYQSAVKALILAGLSEHWGTLDPDRNPDLENISLSYADGLFLVALQDEKIIGTGAILRQPNDCAEVRRMSVAPHMRRHGIGGLLLNQLCAHARSSGCRRVILETTETWQDAVEFYKRFGFQPTHYLDGDVYFALDL